MCPDVFPYYHRGRYQLHLLQETEDLEEGIPKAKPHPITIQTYFLLSHPHPAIVYFLEFKSIFAFFWSLCSFFGIIFLNFCREKNCWEKRTSQLTKTTICRPYSCFNSLQSTEKFVFEKCYTTRFYQLCRVPWLSWETTYSSSLHLLKKVALPWHHIQTAQTDLRTVN